MTIEKGKGTGITSVKVVVTNPITKNGATKKVRTVKSTTKDKVQDTTIYRTIDAEYAPLQLKWIQHSDKFA